MKRRIFLLTGLALCIAVLFSGVVFSEEMVSIKGKVKTIDLNTKTVVVTTSSGDEVSVVVEDETTLAKFKDGRITEGDDVKVKYTTRDGKNISTYFKKAAGC